jgi:hypothetical protein
MQIFSAHQRFDPSCGDSWTDFIQYSGFNHILEVVSTDEMLCPSVLNELSDEDWQYNIHADYKVFYFHDLDYLKRRIEYDANRHNVLSLIERPDSPTVAQVGFEFCGYDVLDEWNSVSVLTNCGGFPDIFSSSEINPRGLLDELSRALEIAEKLRAAEPDDEHCRDCRVWSLCRYSGAA